MIFSHSNAGISDNKPHTKNCMQDIRTPSVPFTQSTFGEKWSIISICNEKKIAHTKTKKSPLPIAKPSVIQRRYRPISDKNTAIHNLISHFFLKKKKLIMGTIIM